MTSLYNHNTNSELEILINQNYGLIVSQALFIKTKDKSLIEDLIQIGILSFIKGVKTFNKNKGGFSTYISRCIRNGTIDYLKKHKKCDYPNIIGNNSSIEKERLWESVPDTLTSEEKSVVMLKLDNYTRKEIANILKKEPREINSIFKKIKQKILEANKI